MNQKPPTCIGCPLYEKGQGFCLPEGSGVNGVLLVGEALGAHEAKAGLPFRPYAPAGSVLERAIVSLGFTREQFGVYNVVACMPPGLELVGAPWEHEAINHCRVHLRGVVKKFRPKIIVALGAVAIRSLTGLGGKKQTVELLQGYCVPCIDFPELRVICCYHPSYIARGQWEVFPILRLILKKAVNIARDGWKEESLDYKEDATIEDLKKLERRLILEPQRTLSVDFETDGEEQDVPDLGIEEDELSGEEETAVEEEDKVEEVEERKSKRITVFQNITQVNYSCEIGTGLAIPFNFSTRPMIQRVLATNNVKVGHNFWSFDMGVAAHNGLHIGGPLPHDTIWSFHHLQPDMPNRKSKRSSDDMRDKDLGSLAPLQFVASLYGQQFPWKHLISEKPGLYGCIDAAATLRVHLGICKDLEAIVCDPEKGTTAFDGYMNMVYDMQSLYTFMSQLGIPINREKIVAFTRSMRAKAREVYDRMVSQYVPKEILPVKHKLGLKKTPKDIETGEYVKKTFVLLEPEKCGCVRKERTDVCVECGTNQKDRVKKPKVRKGTDSQVSLFAGEAEAVTREGEGIVVASEVVGKKPKTGKTCCYSCGANLPTIATCLEDCVECKGTGEIKGFVERYTKLLPFKPSPVQLKAYAAFRGHQIPKNSKRKRAMDKENLERLAHRYKDPLYKSVIEYRGHQKSAETYGAGWMPKEDGRVHPEFNNRPATGQLASADPNCQNVPVESKVGPWAKEFRECIEAPEGYVLIECDWRSFHALTLGLEAGDMDYMRLARLDIHSFICAFLVRDEKRDVALSWPDDELREYLKWIKKTYTRIRNGRAKTAALSYGFGQGANGLYQRNRESFNSISEAQFVIDTMNSLFPKTAAYRVESPALAHRQKRLTTLFGGLRWFWNVLTWEPKERAWVHGLDYEKAIAFRPAANAFSHKKQIAKQLWSERLLQRWGLCNDIHDAFLCCCPIELAEECAYGLATAMRGPSTVLYLPDGTPFSCDVEVKMGRNWGRMEEVKI